jgi:hypothetical protein
MVGVGEKATMAELLEGGLHGALAAYQFADFWQCPDLQETVERFIAERYLDVTTVCDAWCFTASTAGTPLAMLDEACYQLMIRELRAVWGMSPAKVRRLPETLMTRLLVSGDVEMGTGALLLMLWEWAKETVWRRGKEETEETEAKTGRHLDSGGLRDAGKEEEGEGCAYPEDASYREEVYHLMARFTPPYVLFNRSNRQITVAGFDLLAGGGGGGSGARGGGGGVSSIGFGSLRVDPRFHWQRPKELKERA